MEEKGQTTYGRIEKDQRERPLKPKIPQGKLYFQCWDPREKAEDQDWPRG